MTYKEMTKPQLWKEITWFVDITHLSEMDKTSLLKLIEEYGRK